MKLLNMVNDTQAVFSVTYDQTTHLMVVFLRVLRRGGMLLWLSLSESARAGDDGSHSNAPLSGYQHPYNLL
jgi:hypothetical protein